MLTKKLYKYIEDKNKRKYKKLETKVFKSYQETSKKDLFIEQSNKFFS